MVWSSPRVSSEKRLAAPECPAMRAAAAAPIIADWARWDRTRERGSTGIALLLEAEAVHGKTNQDSLCLLVTVGDES